jgi:NAD(P)-dependent dehydrogenase (short-subunit alcohol dehydrogenase family)
MRQRPADDQIPVPSFRLDGRAALVTGGSRGLGLGMALTLAQAGADVAVAARTRDDVDRAVALIEKLGRRAVGLAADVGSVEEARGVVSRAADHFGRLDVLVNAAGINIRQPADTFSEQDWDRLMAINLKGAFFACQEAGRIMRRQGKGKIVNVSSLSSEIVIPNIALYATSKGGMRQMTRALALEWAPHGVHVNAIAPGRFWTLLTDAVFSRPELYDSAVSVIPMGRPGVAADLAGATLLLASDASDYITGQTLVVDGGWLVSGGVKA